MSIGIHIWAVLGTIFCPMTSQRICPWVHELCRSLAWPRSFEWDGHASLIYSTPLVSVPACMYVMVPQWPRRSSCAITPWIPIPTETDDLHAQPSPENFLFAPKITTFLFRRWHRLSFTNPQRILSILSAFDAFKQLYWHCVLFTQLRSPLRINRLFELPWPRPRLNMCRVYFEVTDSIKKRRPSTK